jgi:hypothetical protein
MRPTFSCSGGVLGADRDCDDRTSPSDRCGVMTWWVQDSSAPVVLPDDASGIVAFHQECSTTPDVLDSGSPSRDKGSPRLPQAPTNSRQIQHWTLDLPARLVDHAQGRGARLMEVVCEAGIGWQLARLWVGTRARERSLKQSGGAACRCPVCRLAALGLEPPARPADPLALELGDRVATWAGLPGPLPELPAVAA